MKREIQCTANSKCYNHCLLDLSSNNCFQTSVFTVSASLKCFVRLGQINSLRCPYLRGVRLTEFEHTSFPIGFGRDFQ